MRADRPMLRMNIDDGDIFMAEFTNGAIGSIQTSYVTVGNYPGIEARHLRRGGRDHLPAGRGVRRRRDDQGRHAGRGRVRGARRSRERFYPTGGHAERVVAHAVLRQPDQGLHRRDPDGGDRNQGNFDDGAAVQEVDQRRRALVPRAAMGRSAARGVAVARPTPRRAFAALAGRLLHLVLAHRPVTATFAGIHELRRPPAGLLRAAVSGARWRIPRRC